MTDVVSIEPPRPSGSTEPRARILALDTHWFPQRGGITTFNRLLCIALAGAGAEVCCLVPDPSAQEKKDAHSFGVRLIPAERRAREGAREALRHRVRLGAGHPPNIIIGHGTVTGHEALAQQADYYQEATYLHFIHVSAEDNEWLRPIEEGRNGRHVEDKRQEERDLARSATRVLAVGPALMRIALDHLNTAEDGAYWPIRIDPGFDAPEEHPRKNWEGRTKQIVLAGRLQRGALKGVDPAVRAVAGAIKQLKSDGRDIQLILRGEETYDAQDYQMTDARAVVLCGLALLDECSADDAVNTFLKARRITSEPGVLDYVDLILRQFGEDPADDILRRVRAAAMVPVRSSRDRGNGPTTRTTGT